MAWRHIGGTEDTFRLEAGDTLLADSIHVVPTGSDVSFERFEIPLRPAGGVLVDIQDMPLTFCRDNGLSMKPFNNELMPVRTFLSQNNAWRIILFSGYLAKLERVVIGRLTGTAAGHCGCNRAEMLP